MIRIGLFGANGRMGQSILSVMASAGELSNEISLGCALVRPGHGLNATQISSLNALGQEAYYSSDVTDGFSKSDVMIDFTLPEATKENLSLAQDRMTPMVIGTTGIGPEEHRLMESLAKQVPVFYDTNMSLGVAVLKHLVHEATRMLGDEFDCDIFESHHRYKKDIPSGTAMSLGEEVARARGNQLKDLGTRRFNSKDPSAIQTMHEHKISEVGFSAVRGGGVFGDHDVIFSSDQEQVKLSHRALNRDVFAKGALTAAKWIVNQPPGLYSMKDLLAFKGI